jgi:hypothetical protein
MLWRRYRSVIGKVGMGMALRLFLAGPTILLIQPSPFYADADDAIDMFTFLFQVQAYCR